MRQPALLHAQQRLVADPRLGDVTVPHIFRASRDLARVVALGVDRAGCWAVVVMMGLRGPTVIRSGGASSRGE
eukprot:1195766-Prorocentrum_minimum.AAC.4